MVTVVVVVMMVVVVGGSVGLGRRYSIDLHIGLSSLYLQWLGPSANDSLSY